jgi:hypothetical protein
LSGEPLDKPFLLDHGEGFRRKEPKFKAEDKEIQHITKISVLEQCFFFMLPQNILLYILMKTTVFAML